MGGKQKPYEMWQAGISLAASPLANSLAGFAREGIWRLYRSPAHESRQLRRLTALRCLIFQCMHVARNSTSHPFQFHFQINYHIVNKTAAYLLANKVCVWRARFAKLNKVSYPNFISRLFDCDKKETNGYANICIGPTLKKGNDRTCLV